MRIGMRIISILNHKISFRSKEMVHKDYVPAGVYRNFPVDNTHKSITILDKNSDVIGKYRENRFGHSVGFVVANTDILNLKDMVLSLDESPKGDLADIALESNLKRKVPLRGYLVRFEQYNSLKTGNPKTGFAVYDFNNGQRLARFSQNGFNIPDLDVLADEFVFAENITTLKTPKLKPLDPHMQMLIRLKQIFRMNSENNK